MGFLGRSKIVAVVLVAGVVLAGAGLDPSRSQAAPIALPSGGLARAALKGNSAGAFAYYSLAYPGDGSVATIELRFAPADPVTKLGVGLNVYASNGFFIGPGQMVEDAGGEGVVRVQYSDNNKDTWLVQVYNYIPEHTVAFSVAAWGYSDVSAAPEPITVPPVEVPPPPAPVDDRMTGLLVGDRGGAQRLYTVDYPGKQAELLIEMWYTPADPVMAAAVGFNVYGANGRLIGRGEPRADTGGMGQLRFSYRGEDALDVTVQVYNYLHGAPLKFSVSTELGVN